MSSMMTSINVPSNETDVRGVGKVGEIDPSLSSTLPLSTSSGEGGDGDLSDSQRLADDHSHTSDVINEFNDPTFNRAPKRSMTAGKIGGEVEGESDDPMKGSGTGADRTETKVEKRALTRLEEDIKGPASTRKIVDDSREIIEDRREVVDDRRERELALNEGKEREEEAEEAGRSIGNSAGDILRGLSQCSSLEDLMPKVVRPKSRTPTPLRVLMTLWFLAGNLAAALAGMVLLFVGKANVLFWAIAERGWTAWSDERRVSRIDRSATYTPDIRNQSETASHTPLKVMDGAGVEERAEARSERLDRFQSWVLGAISNLAVWNARCFTNITQVGPAPRDKMTAAEWKAWSGDKSNLFQLAPGVIACRLPRVEEVERLRLKYGVDKGGKGPKSVVGEKGEAASPLSKRYSRRVRVAPPACVVIANHMSNYDGYIMSGQLRHIRCKAIIKSDVARIPIVGWFIALCEAPMIRFTREKNGWATANKDAVLLRCKELLKREISLLVYPEGARRIFARMAPFRVGMIQFAIENETPVLPAAIHGSDRGWRIMSPLMDSADIYTSYANYVILLSKSNDPHKLAPLLQDCCTHLLSSFPAYDPEAEKPIRSLTEYTKMEQAANASKLLRRHWWSVLFSRVKPLPSQSSPSPLPLPSPSPSPLPSVSPSVSPSGVTQ